jgi:hypothetical protein
MITLDEITLPIRNINYLQGPSRLHALKLNNSLAMESKSTQDATHLGYILTRDGINPQSNKVQAILVIQLPKGVKQLRNFLGMVQNL